MGSLPVLTVDTEVHGVLSVPRRERGVFADVRGLVRQAQRWEDDGRVFQIWSSSSDCCILEDDSVPVRGGHGHTEGRVGNCNVLLSAVHQFLPRYLQKEGWRKELMMDGKMSGSQNGVELRQKTSLQSAIYQTDNMQLCVKVYSHHSVILSWK